MLKHAQYMTVSAVVFLVGGLLHGYRVLAGLPMVYGTWVVPVWLSALAALVALYLAYTAFTYKK